MYRIYHPGNDGNDDNDDGPVSNPWRKVIRNEDERQQVMTEMHTSPTGMIIRMLLVGD